jgi:hypothetical protein
MFAIYLHYLQNQYKNSSIPLFRYMELQESNNPPTEVWERNNTRKPLILVNGEVT